jgi:serine/threonine-protein kinase RsbW
LSSEARDGDLSVLLLCESAARPAEFRHAFPASPSELSAMRLRLREWLQQASLDGDVIDATVLGVSEAAANAIEHGLRFDVSGSVTVAARIGNDGLVEVAVGDDGSWREPRGDGDRGYGLRIIRAVMENVSVERLSAGTVVRMGLRSPRSHG